MPKLVVAQMLPNSGMDALHAFLAGSQSRLVAVQAEILLDMAEQPNLPGTVTEYPNWQMRLPVPGARIAGLPATARTAAIMQDNDRQEEGR